MATGKRRAATVVKSMVDDGKVEELTGLLEWKRRVSGYGC